MEGCSEIAQILAGNIHRLFLRRPELFPSSVKPAALPHKPLAFSVNPSVHERPPEPSGQNQQEAAHEA